MFSFRTTPLEKQEDIVLSHGKIGLLCNQTAWHAETGEYLFETLNKKGNLKRLFIPDNGLFVENNVEGLVEKAVYKQFINAATDIVPLYEKRDNTLFIDIEKFLDIDTLIIELQDIGSRYSTYISTIYNIFMLIKENDVNLPIYIIDKINPSGRQVEGTLLRAGYRSIIGIEGIPHRHGLTIGELSYFIYNELNAKFPLHIISYKAYSSVLLPWSITPSPEYSSLFTPMLYSGQKLWEGTNVSNGIGTEKPYEIFGAPFMKELMTTKSIHNSFNLLFDDAAYMRKTLFIPKFGAYREEYCYGFQILLRPDVQYHALAHNLRIIRFMAANCKDFYFLQDKHGADNDKTAIELLLGDKELIDFVLDKSDKNAEKNWQELKKHIKVEEQKWIKKSKKIILYNEPLYRIK